MPALYYSKEVEFFIKEIYYIAENYPKYNLYNYQATLEKYGYQSLQDIDYTTANTELILAMFMTAVRADRFAEGALLHHLNEGHIIKWLKRLKEIVEEK